MGGGFVNIFSWISWWILVIFSVYVCDGIYDVVRNVGWYLRWKIWREEVIGCNIKGCFFLFKVII